MVRLLLVRHGEREREGGELAPLTAGGRWQAETLGAWLGIGPPFKPEAILCSQSRHAREHADIVAGLLSQSAPVIPATALTPRTPETEFNLAAMRREAARTIDWGRIQTVACIGHEPRLNQLAHYP